MLLLTLLLLSRGTTAQSNTIHSIICDTVLHHPAGEYCEVFSISCLNIYEHFSQDTSYHYRQYYSPAKYQREHFSIAFSQSAKEYFSFKDFHLIMGNYTFNFDFPLPSYRLQPNFDFSILQKAEIICTTNSTLNFDVDFQIYIETAEDEIISISKIPTEDKIKAVLIRNIIVKLKDDKVCSNQINFPNIELKVD